MKDILERYHNEETEIQIFIRDKTLEGAIENISGETVHLIGEKYEYHIPITHILGIAAKLNKEKRISITQKMDRVGFKLSDPA